MPYIYCIAAVSPFTCGGYHSLLLYDRSVKEIIEVLSRPEFGGLLAPLPYIVVKRCYLRQYGDPL